MCPPSDRRLTSVGMDLENPPKRVAKGDAPSIRVFELESQSAEKLFYRALGTVPDRETADRFLAGDDVEVAPYEPEGQATPA